MGQSFMPVEAWKSFLAILILLVAARIFLFAYTQYTVDDAFITYRYAANVASGLGYVYNAGEKVQGASSPLYTLILTAVGWAFHPDVIPQASRILSLIADVLSLILLWRILSGFDDVVRICVGLLFALYPKVVFIGTTGMEASLVVMLMLLSYYLYSIGKLYGALFVMSSLMLCRLDSVVWIVLCLFSIKRVYRTFPVRAALLAVLVCVPWVVFAFLYFGSLLPHSIAAKSVSWHNLFPAFDPFRIIMGYFPFDGLKGVPAAVRWLIAVVFVLPVVVELVKSLSSKSPMFIFPSFFLLYNLAFSFGRVTMLDWYYLPGYIVYFVTAGSLCNRPLSRWNSGLRYRKLMVSAQAVLAVILLALLFVAASRWAERPGGSSLRTSKRLGIWLRRHSSANAGVLLEPIGLVGWESKLYIHDYIGIVSPHVISYRQRYPGSDAWFMAYIRDSLPEYIVLRNYEIPRNMLVYGQGDGLFHGETERKWFESQYRQVEWNPCAAVEDTVYLVLYQHLNPASTAESRSGTDLNNKLPSVKTSLAFASF